MRPSSSVQTRSTRSADRNVPPEDDWLGIIDRVERRRRQNRLSQRTYRKRRSPQVQFITEINRRSDLSVQQKEQQILEHLTSAAYQSYILGSPAIDHLFSLSRINVYRAFATNIGLLGLVMDGLCGADILSPFNQASPATAATESYPPSLSPTPTQRSRHHHPWLDFFPHPGVRDNMILAQGTYDEDELCLDIFGFWNPDAADNMLLIWGEPHNPANWEVTESFVKKWGWVIRGCPDVLYNTNLWRAMRGESPIMRYL